MADGISGLGATFSGEREFGDKLPGDLESFSYDDEIVRMFSTATLLWGLVAFLVALIVAVLLVIPKLSMGIEYISFGRLRLAH